jgi:hypothetical protein
MRVEIVHELDPGDSRLEIPWMANRARRFRDLKAFPEGIDALPECRAYPPLAGLLRRLNAPRSPLRTAKCDVWETTELSSDEWADFRLPSKTGSYVDVVFDAPRLRLERAPHQRLAEQTARRLQSFRARAQLDIVLRRCLFHPQEVWGYALTFFLHAYGPTARQARSAWSRALRRLAQALLGASRPPRKTLR